MCESVKLFKVDGEECTLEISDVEGFCNLGGHQNIQIWDKKRTGNMDIHQVAKEFDQIRQSIAGAHGWVWCRKYRHLLSGKDDIVFSESLKTVIISPCTEDAIIFLSECCLKLRTVRASVQDEIDYKIVTDLARQRNSTSPSEE